MNREEVLELIKRLRRDLDNTRASRKRARKCYNQLLEKYCEGHEDALLTAIEVIQTIQERHK